MSVISSELSKDEKRKMKRFQLENKDDFRVYLHEIIGRMDKCIVKYKRYLQRMNNYIQKITEEDNIRNDSPMPYDDYSEFVDLFSSVDSYVLNLIGDSQDNSISYKKFRDILAKRKNKNTLDFEIRELDEKTVLLINDLNKMRNWINHVPESLLVSQIKLIDEGNLCKHDVNPIGIYYHNYCTFELLKDLFDTSQNFYKGIRRIHQNMKKDYSSLIGERVEVERIFLDKPKGVEHLEMAKLSASVQGIKGSLD